MSQSGKRSRSVQAASIAELCCPCGSRDLAIHIPEGEGTGGAALSGSPWVLECPKCGDLIKLHIVERLESTWHRFAGDPRRN